MEIEPGISNQLGLSTFKMYNDLTMEKLESALDEILNTMEEKNNLPPYGYVGEGLYHIGNGCYCNKKGFDEFEKEFIDNLKCKCGKIVNTPKIGLAKLNKLEIRSIEDDIKKRQSKKC